VEDAGGRLTVQTYGPVALPADSATTAPDALVQGLSTLVASAGVKRTRLAAALPRSAATLKFPILPQTSPQQLAQMVRFEAQRYIPFAVEDVILSFQNLPGQSRHEATAQGIADQMELLLIAVRRDTVAEYRQAVTAAGAALSHLCVSTMGLWNALHHSPVPSDPDEATVVLDLGGRSSSVVAFHQGEMIFNRAAGVGSEGLTHAFMSDGTDRGMAESHKRDVGLEPLIETLPESPLVRTATPAEQWSQGLVSELRRSLAALRGEHRELRVERLFLVGGGAKTPALAQYLESALGLPTQPLELPGLVSDPQFIEAVGVAIGALDRGISEIDLVPEEVEREKNRRREATKIRLGALVGAVVLAGAVYFAVGSIQQNQANSQKINQAQDALNATNEELKTTQARYEKLTGQKQMLTTALQRQFTWLDVLQDISDRAPSGVWLSAVELEKGKSLAIRGTALNQAAVQAFWSNLSRSPMLVKPTLSYANQAKVADKTVFQFGITSDIVGNEGKPAKPVKKKSTRRATGSKTGTTGGTTGTNAGGSTAGAGAGPT
jgi:type IV pilus assembly protein PilM